MILFCICVVSFLFPAFRPSFMQHFLFDCGLSTTSTSHSYRSFLSTYRWFTIGSIGFVLTGSITLANSYDSGKLMGEDDSTLSLDDYRATWWLVVVSGWFCIFGESFLLLWFA